MAGPPDPNQRVCPECGAPAGEAPFCSGCGVNLSGHAQLPTRAEWEGKPSTAELIDQVKAGDAPAPPPPPTPSLAAAPSKKPLPRWFLPTGITLAAVAALGLVALFVFGPNKKTFEMPSEAMRPTFEVGDQFNANLDDTIPEIGEVIVFHPPVGSERSNACGVPRRPAEACPEPTMELSDTNFAKRVVAVGGDRLHIEDGVAIRNGEPVDGDWETLPCRTGGACNLPTEIVIPEDHYFVIGDNVGASDDSRYWGPVPQSAIVGVVDE